MAKEAVAEALALGAHRSAAGVTFRAFTSASSCAVELVAADGSALALEQLTPLGDGYFELELPGVTHGDRYWFVVNGRRLPDPYARWLPQGVHGPASVYFSSHVPRHAAPERTLAKQVLYELHIGTFTQQGTFEAARQRLGALAELGVTTLELMPVAAFAGQHGWGYDGVALYATHAAYGAPDELRQLIDDAHGLGLSVLLDVVYNHLGPAGNYLSCYADSYFSKEDHNAWGQAPRFDDPAWRALVLGSARYWLEDVGFDGLRLDATHAIVDRSPRHVLSELAKLARESQPSRITIAEDERNLPELVTELGLDALWADDFHHQLHVSLTGERHGYYADFEPGAEGLAQTINRGWFYAGQPRRTTSEPRGRPCQDLAAEALVYSLQNHDQIGNRARGERLSALISPSAYRGASLLLLFLPMTPLLFMGQEWAAGTPFLYFTDHEPELGAAVRDGRRREFAAFPEFADAQAREQIPDPQAVTTWRASQLRWAERELPEHREVLNLYRAALELRLRDPVLSHSGREELLAEAGGSILTVHRWHKNERRALVMNLGAKAVALASTIPALRLRNPRRLLTSSSEVEELLPPGAAAIFAGEGNLVGLVESGT